LTEASLGSPDSQRVAARLIAGLANAGVSHFLVAPGARSQALALAAEQLEAAGLARLVVRLDERTLGFTALGLAAAGKLAAVITTSGTAVANLHPAVLEAHHAGVPMLLLTADRPASLRGTGANQTTLQLSMFAEATRATFDVSADTALTDATIDELVESAVSLARGEAPGESARARSKAAHEQTALSQPGPVQLNLQFREPLSALEPNAADLARAMAQTSAVATGDVTENQRIASQGSVTEVSFAPGTVVLAGAKAGVGANEFAAAGGYPLFAEPSSGARFGSQLIRRYADLASHPLAEKIERIVVFGKPTLHRKVLALLARPEIELVVVNDRAHGYFNPSGREATQLAMATAAPGTEGSWLAQWLAAEAELTAPTDGTELNRVELVDAVWRAAASQGGSKLLIGASELIRVADRFAPAFGIECFANRGLAGIDGTIATGLGMALAEPSSQVRVLLGDLTLLHDVGSLNLSDIGTPDIQLIVGNDGGGRIFERLEIASLAKPEQFARLFLTPQRVDIESLAKAYGWRYFKTTPQLLASRLAERGPVLIDVTL
jgi:2-succinyl-5-enolpyruvyl-6-hydroxy-3-cyclohexene-1-carboxylate synthase